MSDGPSKLSPAEAQPLDDIILGDDDQTAPVPVPAVPRREKKGTVPPAAPTTRMASEPDEERATTRGSDPGLKEGKDANAKDAKDPKDGKEGRKRQRLTLRIPDDEVSRPQLPATTPMGGVPVVSPSRPPSSPEYEKPQRPDLGRPVVDPEATQVMARPKTGAPPPPAAPVAAGDAPRFDGSADDTLELPAMRDGVPPRRALGIDADSEPGWTPFQPPVSDVEVTTKMDGRPAETHAKAGNAAPMAPVRDARTIVDEGERAFMRTEAGGTPAVRMKDEAPPVSEEIPIDTDEEPISRETPEDAVTHPRLPVALDSEEIKLDEGERHTDPGEVPEVEPEDLVSVESLPNPNAPPPLKGGAKIVNAPATPALTATALMSGATPAAPPVAPVAPLAAVSAAAAAAAPAPTLPLAAPAANHPPVAPAPAAPPAAPSSPAAVHAAPAAAARAPSVPPPAAAAAAGPVPGAPMARRPQPAGGPFGLMPSASALAPPPMNEAAANRKKTRPWWEDLFNDDFIRTMAKITDADIAREVTFIEESLGCEAGATILDLACGTGRHAVELAARGYQVVGFDLSLAMLARASDEAQDRKQKINFVQGDMREMTFEETFDGIFSWNTSFGYFDEEKNAAVIAKVHRALKKGGQFLLDVVNRDYIIRQAPSLAWFEGDGCICMDEMGIDFITSRMKVKRTLMMDDGRTKEIEYSIRAYALHELGKMLHDNGFRVAEVSGRTGTPGVFFGCESPRTLILAEKR